MGYWVEEDKCELYAKWITQFIPYEWTRQINIIKAVNLPKRRETIKQSIKEALKRGYIERQVLSDWEISHKRGDEKSPKWSRYRLITLFEGIKCPVIERGIK